MGFKVVVPLKAGGESEKYPERFRELGAEIVMEHCDTDEEFIALAGDADAIITVGSIRPVPRQVIEELELCRLISNTQIGYDSIDVEAATERGILVTNVPDYCVEEVSDHAMALLLACARRVVQLHEAAKRGQWGLSPDGIQIQSRIWPSLMRLQGRTLGLLGLGKVSRALVPKAKGFQLRLIAHDPHVPPEVFQRLDVKMVDLKTLLTESDFLSVHAALTPETTRILGEEEFRQMKPTACLINTSRGAIVDESALSQALRQGDIAMAALDVTDPEPPGATSPLLSMENAIITAHSAFFSPVSEADRWYRPTEEVSRVMSGEWPAALVNPQAKEKYTEKWGPMKRAVKE
jgi:D-3-phosphoglycerate dehydrogenase